MKNIVCLLCALLFIACSDDKGNYDYEEINEVLVKLETEYEVKLQKMEYKIQPELSQTLSQNRDNLQFTWYYSDASSNFHGIASIEGALDTVSREDFAILSIDPEDENLKYEHYFRFNVYDKLTGIEYPFNTKIKLIKPYHGTWTLLHRQDDVTKLATIEYLGDEPLVSIDAYNQETGKHLMGNPLFLGVNFDYIRYYLGENSIFLIATDIPDEAGVYCQWKGFQKKDSLSRMVAPSYRGEFNYQNVDYFSASMGSGGMCISDGVFYQIAEGMKFYKAHIASTITGDTYFSNGQKISSYFILYDKAGKRFLYYDGLKDFDDMNYNPNVFNETGENDPKYQVLSIPIRDQNVKTADPANLGVDKEVLYIGYGYDSKCYALALSQEKDSCYVYEFNTMGFRYASYASFTGFYRIKRPENFTQESCITSSVAFNGIIYYASGDQVYKLDFMQQGGKASPVYTHPGGNAKVLKFAYSREPHVYQDFSAYEHDLTRSLGVVFEMADGTSEFVVLNLSITGKIAPDGEKWPSLQVYKGFGGVKDVLFL